MAKYKKKITEDKTPSGFDFFALIDIGLTLWVAYLFFQLWVMPSAGDIDRIYYMSILIAFEFIMIHSGVFMAAMPLKISLLVFFPLYGVFALAFNTMIPDNSIMFIYLIVVLNRMRFAFFSVSESVKMQNLGMSVYAAVVYFFLMIGVAFLSWMVPKFGLTPEFLSNAGYNPSVKGLFTEIPQTAMCLGFLYYIMLALFNILIFTNGIKRSLALKRSLNL